MAPTPIHFGASGWRGILGDDCTLFKENLPSCLAGARVRDVRSQDGTLLLREGGSWILPRPSGIRRRVRCHAEARSPKELARLLDAGRALALSP